MLDSSMVPVLLAICTAISLYLLKCLLPSSKRPPLPPGPSFVSLISQTFRALSSAEESVSSLAKLTQKYGDIVHISLLNQHIIIVNSAQMAIDMMESKGPIYSDRQATPMMKLSGWSNVMPFAQPGPFWRQQRAYIHKLFGTQSALSRHYSVIEGESHRFLQRLLSSPEELADCVRLFAGSIVLKITYGYTTEDHDDPLISSADKLVRELSFVINLDSLPWMVNLFPSLEKLPDWFPGTHFKKSAKKWSNQIQEFIDAPFQLVKRQMAAGTAIPSFTSDLLTEGNISPEDAHQIKMASMVIYAAGADSTVSIVRGFFLAMALNPDVFKKAREEIDAVVGTQRLPSITDRIHLPYVNALILEVFRWNVVTQNGVPHKTSQDDVHAGYFIPKGSTIVPNIWFMLKDPRLYKDPERFMPERFLGESPEKDPREMAFGFGRRICSGRLLADETVFIVCTMSIAVFDIQKEVKDGVFVEPVCRVAPGFISHLEPYKIDVKPRSVQAVSLVQELQAAMRG